MVSHVSISGPVFSSSCCHVQTEIVSRVALFSLFCHKHISRRLVSHYFENYVHHHTFFFKYFCTYQQWTNKCQIDKLIFRRKNVFIEAHSAICLKTRVSVVEFLYRHTPDSFENWNVWRWYRFCKQTEHKLGRKQKKNLKDMACVRMSLKECFFSAGDIWQLSANNGFV